MEFWQWIFAQGLPNLKGDWRAYATGKHSTGQAVTRAEYRHALDVIMGHVVAARRPGSGYNIAFPGIAMEMLRAAGGLVNDEEIAYWAGQSSSSELGGFLDTVSGRLVRAAASTPAAPPRAPSPQPSQPAPPPAPSPSTPATPSPEPDTTPPEPEPRNWQGEASALYPWLNPTLLHLFTDLWSDSGDANLALAQLRQTNEYDQFFAGIKRDDGSLRMTESEWFSTREAYGTLFREFGLNDSLFTDRFTELMEGDVSASELAARLGGAYELMNSIPEVRDAFEGITGAAGGPAVFAWFIDPDLGDAIINKTVSIAQVAGEGLARGFDTVGSGLAERLVAGGVDQGLARNFFVQAEGQLFNLDQLAARHRDPDDDFSLEEFAEANVFGDATQTRRIRRLLRQEASLFSPREVGTVQTRNDFALTGLTPA